MVRRSALLPRSPGLFSTGDLSCGARRGHLLERRSFRPVSGCQSQAGGPVFPMPDGPISGRFRTDILRCHPHRAFWKREPGVVHFGSSRVSPVRCRGRARHVPSGGCLRQDVGSAGASPYRPGPPRARWSRRRLRGSVALPSALTEQRPPETEAPRVSPVRCFNPSGQGEHSIRC